MTFKVLISVLFTGLMLDFAVSRYTQERYDFPGGGEVFDAPRRQEVSDFPRSQERFDFPQERQDFLHRIMNDYMQTRYMDGVKRETCSQCMDRAVNHFGASPSAAEQMCKDAGRCSR